MAMPNSVIDGRRCWTSAEDNRWASHEAAESSHSPKKRLASRGGWRQHHRAFKERSTPPKLSRQPRPICTWGAKKLRGSLWRSGLSLCRVSLPLGVDEELKYLLNVDGPKKSIGENAVLQGDVDTFHWLPAEFDNSPEGAVDILSYITSLKAEVESRLYRLLEQIFEEFTSLFNDVPEKKVVLGSLENWEEKIRPIIVPPFAQLLWRYPIIHHQRSPQDEKLPGTSDFWGCSGIGRSSFGRKEDKGCTSIWDSKASQAS